MIAAIRQIAPPDWLLQPETRAIIDAFQSADTAIRFVGGCVRDTLRGDWVGDVDATTPARPEVIISIAQAAGLKAIPTGIDHGTITVISSGQSFQITTLRADMATDGRYAAVAFTDNWIEDAKRRDFTINALYMDGDGVIYDPVGGFNDLEPLRVRFIGDADQRICEDYLRILRFYRFMARLGVTTFDKAGTAACARHKAGLKRLSVERITAEIIKLLEAKNPVPVCQMMEKDGVLDICLPQTQELTVLACLIDREVKLELPPDALRRLSHLLPRDEVTRRIAIRKYLRLSNAEVGQLLRASRIWHKPPRSPHDVRVALYTLGLEAVQDALHGLSGLSHPDWWALWDVTQLWDPPLFPVKGKDLMALGYPAGSCLGRRLKELENSWIDSDFTLSKNDLLDDVRAELENA